MSIKEKLSAMCDRAEEKLAEFKAKREERKQKRKEFWEKHPNLERFCATAMVVGGTIGVTGLYGALIAASVKDQREHPEKYLNKKSEEEELKQESFDDVLFGIMDQYGFEPGDEIKMSVSDDGYKKVTYNYAVTDKPASQEKDDAEKDEPEKGTIEFCQF